MRTALVVISAIYLLRGLVLAHAVVFMPNVIDDFLVWSSLIVLAYGVVYAVGTWRAWASLRPARQ